MDYQQLFLDYINSQKRQRTPKNLYEPIEYILLLSGKRIRPILTLMGCDVFDKNPKEALPAAMAVEIFHNFSLVHDDIMDNAPLRRGNPTIHEKWNINTGILSGDAMLILAYQYFEQYRPEIFQELAKLFSKTALEVCEGQQWDIDFQVDNNVSIDQYLKMIEYKTAVLAAASLQMGAIVAETSDKNKKDIYDFGLNLGISFQLQDDYLDTFGNQATFGKQIGGDIIENKKTYLYLQTLLRSSDQDKQRLLYLYNETQTDNKAKIEEVSQIFRKYEIDKITTEAVDEYTNRALDILKNMNIKEDKKQMLVDFAQMLIRRNV
ncbi:MAG: polyprenyl synthetase family protein [Bacteroidota bacterium]|nr:polyprenyl synthetase family protein [Bacteroidota bacterium]